MIRRYGTELRAAMMLADIAVTAFLAVALSAVMLPGFATGFWSTRLPDPVSALALFVSAWVTILWLHGAYRLRARWSVTSETRLILNAIVWFALLTFAFLYLAKLPDVSRAYLIVLLAAMLGTTVMVRACMRWALQIARRRGQNLRNILILGTGLQGRLFAQKIVEHPELGLNVLGFLGEPIDDLPRRWAYLGPSTTCPTSSIARSSTRSPCAWSPTNGTSSSRSRPSASRRARSSGCPSRCRACRTRPATSKTWTGCRSSRC